MILFRRNDDYEPVTWVRGVPIYVTTLLILSHVLAAIVLLLVPEPVALLGFSSVAIWEHGQVWRFLSYPWAHSPFNLLFFAIEMLLLFAFGRDVEGYLGRRRFVGFYALLIVVPAAAVALLGLAVPTAITGSREIHFSIFLMFALLYPGVEMIFRIQARWLAWGLFAFFGLYDLSVGNLAGALGLIISGATALVYITWLRGGFSGWREAFVRPWEPERAPAPPRPRVKLTQEAAPDPVAAIDPLLDKIAEHGMESLTPQEVVRLEEARAALLRRSEGEGKSLSARR